MVGSQGSRCHWSLLVAHLQTEQRLRAPRSFKEPASIRPQINLRSSSQHIVTVAGQKSTCRVQQLLDLATEHAASCTVHQSRSIYRLPLSVKAKGSISAHAGNSSIKALPCRSNSRDLYKPHCPHTVPFAYKAVAWQFPPQLQPLEAERRGSAKGKEELVIGRQTGEAFTTGAAAYLGQGTMWANRSRDLCARQRPGFMMLILQMSQAAISDCWEAVFLSQHNLIKERTTAGHLTSQAKPQPRYSIGDEVERNAKTTTSAFCLARGTASSRPRIESSCCPDGPNNATQDVSTHSQPTAAYRVTRVAAPTHIRTRTRDENELLRLPLLHRALAEMHDASRSAYGAPLGRWRSPWDLVVRAETPVANGDECGLLLIARLVSLLCLKVREHQVLSANPCMIVCVESYRPREIAESTAETCCSHTEDEKQDTRAIICSPGRISSMLPSPSASPSFPRRDLVGRFREQLQVCPIGHVVFSLCIPPMDLVSDPSTIVQGTTSTPPHPRPLAAPKGNRGPPPPLVVSRGRQGQWWTVVGGA
ncbi:uncharacterized protein TRIREDRAFT_104263 [Trichoderma reesei QM6a]|uniref:Predicted protein n=2 Tax=Hypocrea jecorina TaxID=51453 RepID=G0RBW9_HYPJQ|nr:uncharacterized protein TRIREDRAFT_104263 [Trichoderma reesei QM6a]EGR51128.1 predicted protein [Trichoderma reesei QM6a]ETS04668.1 hypothetical protein M419DRAFT_127782 [Trichoderma reesei RUT C-30]